MIFFAARKALRVLWCNPWELCEVKMDIQDWAGVAGFFMAMGALGWQWWTWKEARRESIKLRASYEERASDTPHGRITVEVVNLGDRPIHQLSVLLCHRLTEPPTTTGTVTVTPSTEEIKFNTISGESAEDPLKPGQGRKYNLFPTVASDIYLKLAALPSHDVWIEARSPKGKIEDLRGDDVFTLISSAAESVRKFQAAQSISPRKRRKAEW